MLSLYTKKGWKPISKRTNFNVLYEYEGEQTLSFDIYKNDDLYKEIEEESRIEFEENYFKVKIINQRSKISTIQCILDLTEWHSSFFHDYRKTYALFSEIMLEVAPRGWAIEGAGSVTGRRTIECIGGSAYDILMTCKKTYNIVYEFHIKDKKIKIIKPDVVQSRGLYVTEDLNLTQLTYKGDSSKLVTRLYAYGKKTEEKDDEGNTTSIKYVNFASINGGKPYIDNNDYSNDIIVAYWQDDRYTDAQSLLDDSIDKLKELSKPQRSYSCKIYDLSRIKEEYKCLDFKLYDKVTLIDNDVCMQHQIVQYKRYPDDETNNDIILSSVFKKITGTIDGIKQSVSDIDTEIKRTENSINEIIRDVASNTARIKNTYTKGETDTQIESVVQQTADEINQSISKIEVVTKNISKLRFTSDLREESTIISYAIPSSVAKAIIYDYGVDVTDFFLDSEINWIRESDDTEGDKYWNSEYGRGRKQIRVTRDDIKVRARFGFTYDTSRYESLYPNNNEVN